MDDSTPYWEIPTSLSRDKQVEVFVHAMNTEQYTLAYNLFLRYCHYLIEKCDEEILLKLHQVHNLCSLMYHFNIYIHRVDILLEIMEIYSLNDYVICDMWPVISGMLGRVLDLYKYEVFRFDWLSIDILPSQEDILMFLDRGIYPYVKPDQLSNLPIPDKPHPRFTEWCQKIIYQPLDVSILPQTILNVLNLEHYEKFAEYSRKFGVSSITLAYHRYTLQNHIALDLLIEVCRDKIMYVSVSAANIEIFLGDLGELLRQGFIIIIYSYSTKNITEIMKRTAEIYDKYGWEHMKHTQVKSATSITATPRSGIIFFLIH